MATVQNDSSVARGQTLLEAFLSLVSPLGNVRKPPDGETAEQTILSLRQLATKKAWPPTQLFVALLSLATASDRWNGEEDGVKFVDAAATIDPESAKTHRDALSLFQGCLWTGTAVNYLNAGKLDRAVHAYLQALKKHVELRLEHAVLDSLARLSDLVRNPHQGILEMVLWELSPLAIQIELHVGPRAAIHLQQLYRTLNTACSDLPEGVNRDVLLMLWQFAKGLRFSRMISCGTSALHNLDEQGNRELRAMAWHEERLYQDLSQHTALDEDVLTRVLVDSDLSSVDASKLGLSQLRQRFEFTLSQYLTATADTAGTAGWFKPILLGSRDIQDLLDDRTVVLHHYLGSTKEGRSALYLLLVTKETVELCRIEHDFPADWLLREDDGEPPRSTLGVLAAMIRSSIVLDPRKGKRVHAEAATLLKELLPGFLGPFQERLEQLRSQGKDHLCVVPHGPSHYLPFHLFGDESEPIGTRWIVTYLPNLTLLAVHKKRPKPLWQAKSEMNAIAIDYTDDANWPGLPGVSEFANELAGLFGSTPWINEDASLEHVLAILFSSRYVHVCAHGKHVEHAPSFQFIPLFSKAGEAERLCGHHVLSRDLRNLEILTLGACETALGRFDALDNLRGLPAFFFMAGVSSIVGTLWEVELNTCLCFFKEFYTNLRDGKSSLDSFAAAQIVTRKRHPQHRDWGAFVFLGSWFKPGDDDDIPKTVPGIPSMTFFGPQRLLTVSVRSGPFFPAETATLTIVSTTNGSGHHETREP